MTEAELQRRIRAAVEKQGGKCLKTHGSPYAVAGTPDLIGSLGGKPFAVEVKLPGKVSTLTVKQQHELEAWEKQGWSVGVATSVDEALQIITGGAGQ